MALGLVSHRSLLVSEASITAGVCTRKALSCRVRRQNVLVQIANLRACMTMHQLLDNHLISNEHVYL